MIGDGKGLRISAVLAVASTVAVLGFLAMRWWAGSGRPLPQPSFTVAGVLVVLAVAEFMVARRIRRGVAGTSKRPLDPLWTHRMLLTGQAAALTGGVVAGWYLALVGVVLPDIDAESARRIAWASVALAGGGAVLAAGGFAIQAACRIDPPDVSAEDWGDEGDAWAERRLPEG